MNKIIRNRSVFLIPCFLVALCFVLLVQGAIPFLAVPTLGQAIWTIGFSQSFVNDSIFSIYAQNFGAPKPAAIAFGLSGAWPAALFIRLGLSAIDAYAMTSVLWFTVGFISSYKIGAYLNVSPFGAILGALTWMTMPIIWAHSGYSMLSFGISLLPFYFLAAIRLFSVDKNNNIGKSTRIIIGFQYFIVSVVSVFMDGYSFMMFAVASTTLLFNTLFKSDRSAKILLFKFSIPVHVICIYSAYLLYTSFIGGEGHSLSSIDFFRAWGVDVVFLLAPSKGVHWIMDLIGVSTYRSKEYFWGDASVWSTSFCAPIILSGIFSFFALRPKTKYIYYFSLLTIFGIYMSLGPSLKFNSHKPIGYETISEMPEVYSITPTGSSVLSSNLPGFIHMRSSYRWLALGVFGAWMLSLSALSLNGRKRKVYGGVFLSLVTLLNLPKLPEKLKGYINNRDAFLALESDFIDDMSEFVSPGEKLAFLPWRNDFLVNYVASKLKVITYNVGGDKNFNRARSHWPATMRKFPMATIDEYFANRVLLLLANKEADVVILPYIDMLWAAHRWPYPASLEEGMIPIIGQLEEAGVTEIVKREYFSTVRLAPKWETATASEILKAANMNCFPPFCIEKNGFSQPIHSRVGVLSERCLESTGRRGMLHFGPYVPMNSGAYRLRVYGSARSTDGAWVDVASDQGRKVHARFNLSEKSENSDQVMVDEEIRLEHDVGDLEIRIYVESETEVSLRGYSLK